MSIVLVQEFVSSNEACIKWTVDSTLISLSSKGFLYITDVTQFDETMSNTVISSITSFPIQKYQLRSNELLNGSVIFENLKVGNYICELVIINGSAVATSDPLDVQVFYLANPEFIDVISGNQRFTAILSAPTCDVQNVTFILLGKLIVAGNTQSFIANTETVVFDYSINNTYVITQVVNNNEYELACFYTNYNGISSAISDTLVETPTDTPNQITTLTAVNVAASQTLTISHGMPNNAADYDLVDCRATITDSNNVVSHYLSSENTALLSPVPSASDPVVFNMNNQSSLPVDVPFTVTLSVKNEIGDWGPVESPAVYCIHPANFCAVSLLPANLNYSVGLNSIAITDNMSYSKNSVYTINYTADLFLCDIQGAPIGSAVETLVQDNLNFNFTGLVTGSKYKVVFNLNYTYTFPDSTSIVIGQQNDNTCFYYFIPHDIPNQHELIVSPDDLNVVVSWSDVDLNGFDLARYDVSSDNVNWISNQSLTSYNFDQLVNGTEYTFYVRAVSVSNWSKYMNTDSVLSNVVAAISVPFGDPNQVIIQSQTPGDGVCTITWKLDTVDPYNGGQFLRFQIRNIPNKYTISSNAVDNLYTYEITDLTNLTSNRLELEIVTTNIHHTTDVFPASEKVSGTEIITTPFQLPSMPVNLAVSPNTNTVDLTWDAVSPPQIINQNVEYELYYKLQTDSNFTIVSNIVTNSYTVSGLTSNVFYDFKIHSTILNTEIDTIFYSDFTAIISNQPFIYLNPPNMDLSASHSAIMVKLSPNVKNFYQTTFNYRAVLSDMAGDNAITNSSITGVINSNSQNILFTVLGDGTSLIDLTQYKIVADYQMLNTNNGRYYWSESVSNNIKPYDSGLSVVLSSVSLNQSVELTWDMSNLIGYTITEYQLSINGGDYTIIDSSVIYPVEIYPEPLYSYRTTVSLDQTQSDLINGNSYTFNIQAILLENNISIVSTASNIVTNIPYTNPEVPINIQTELSDQQIILSWSAPNNLNGLSLDHYEVRCSQISAFNSWTTVNTDLTHTFNGLTNGQLYDFYIQTVTIDTLEGGKLIYSGGSNIVVNIPYVKASAPVFSSALEQNTSVTYGWVTGDLGGLTNWYFQTSQTVDSWTDCGHNGSLSISGVNGTALPLYVRVVTIHPYLIDHVIGDTYTPTALTPYINASVVVLSCVEKDQELDFTWSDPELGGLPLDHYEFFGVGGVLDWINIGSVNSYNMVYVAQYNLTDDIVSNSLINGAKYYVMVRAVTSHINPISGVSSPVNGFDDGNNNYFSPVASSNAPTFDSCEEQDQKLVFAWNALVPSVFNAQILDSYQVSCDNVNWTTVDKTILSYTFEGLVNGSKYTLYARAVTIHPTQGLILGNILATTDQFVPYALAAAPTFASCEEQDQQLVFAWNAVTELNGLSLDSYQVSCDNVDWITVTKNTLTYTFDGLVNGSAYTLYARAVTTGSHVDPVYGQIFATVGTFIPYHVPSAPTLNNVIIMTPNVVVNADSDLHGLVLDHYEVSIDGTTFASVLINNDMVSSADANFVYVVGDAYFFQFRAITIHPNLGLLVGDTYSVNATCYTSEAGNYPINVQTEPLDGQVNLTWEPAAYQQFGLPFDHYAVGIHKGLDPFNWIQVGTSQDNMQTSYTFDGLTNGDRYTFVIKSVYKDQYAPGITDTYDAAYISSDNYSVIDQPFAQPDLIVNMVATPGSGDGYINFSWSPASSIMGGLPFNKYQYSTDDSTWIDLSVSNVRIASLSGAFLTLYVRNVTLQMDLTLIFGQSRSVSNTSYEAPSVTSGYNTVASDRQVVFSWDPSSNLQGLPFDHYEVSLDQGVNWIVSDANPSYTFAVANGYAGNKFLSRSVTVHPDLLVGFIKGIYNISTYVTGIAFVKPGAVTNIRASAINGTLTFSFSGPVDVNNDAFTQNFEYSLDGFVTTVLLYQLTSQQIAIGNDTFQLSIRCYIVDPNDDVTHVLSSVKISADLKNINISTPQNLQAIVGNSTVTLSWNQVPGYSYQVIRYALLDGTIAVRDIVTNPSYTFSNLVNGTEYQFSVSILVNGQAGSVSNISATPVDMPSIISVAKSGDNLILNINFGGASKVQIDVGAFVISNNLIVGIATHLDVVNSSTVNPITISGMSSYDYFNITVSNIIGSVSQANQI